MTSKDKKQAALSEIHRMTSTLSAQTEQLNALLEVLAVDYFDYDIKDVSDISSHFEEISEMVSGYRRYGILVHCAIDLVESIEAKVDGIDELISEIKGN